MVIHILYNKVIRGIYILVFSIMFFTISSCEDFIDVDAPRDEIVRGTALSDDESAVSIISGIYSEMVSDRAFMSGGRMEKYLGWYADELTTFSNSVNDLEFLNSALLPVNGQVNIFWRNAYKYILNVNTLLEGLEESERITQDTKNQLVGEAKFIRALCHFYLTNLYGPVPLVTTSDFQVNNSSSRNPEEEVYEQIILDLSEASELLSDNFEFAGGERVRPNKDAAIALLSRVFLYTGDWQQAEEFSGSLINNSLYNLEPDPDKVFLANSTEAIWQLKPVGPSNLATPQGIEFILPESDGPPGSTWSFLRNDFIDSFEANDNRLSAWVNFVTDNDGVDYFYSFKYKNNITPTNSDDSEYLVVLRLAEQFLIRAEARAMQGDLAGAIADIDVVRNRAGLPLIQDTNPAIDESTFLMVIEQERKIELFTEGGHRWLDLKRTGRANDVLAPIKPSWKPTNVLFPINELELQKNPNLAPQNDGY